MALVAGQISNLINGISQQPDSIRLSSQAEVQENFFSSVVDSLIRRSPTRHVAQLSTDDWTDAWVHTINRDATERYVVVIYDGDLEVYGIDGSTKTVTFPDGKGYLSATTDRTDFRAVTVADTTFVANRTVEVAMDSATTATRPYEALVAVKQGAYDQTYTIEINGASAATYTTSDTDPGTLPTDYIAEQLYNALVAGALSGFSYARYNDAIHISNATTDFDIAVSGGSAKTSFTVAKEEVQSFDDLPATGPDGFKVRILGNVEGADDDYYVEFSKTDPDNSSGAWIETVAAGVQYQFDASTMPHTLVRQADGSFVFGEATWLTRTAGDATSNFDPSFVGDKVNEVFFYKNRLGFLADENIILSRAGDFYNFWRNTVTALLDDERIDLSSTSTQVGLLRYAVNFDRKLFVFSDVTQFELTSGDVLSPQTAALGQVTSYEVDVNCPPVSTGRTIFYAIDRGSFNGMSEYYIEDTAGLETAADVTGHVQKYVPFGAYRILSSINEDIAFVLTRGELNAIYVYKYFWQGNEKIQSSWSKYILGSDAVILNGGIIDSRLYLVVKRTNEVSLEYIDIEAGAVDSDSEELIRLDRGVLESDCVVSYSAGTGLTTVTLPYKEEATCRIVIRAGNLTESLPEGYVLTATRVDNETYTIVGDYSSAKFLIGLPYTSKYTFSKFQTRIIRRNQEVTIRGGRFQVHRLLLEFENTTDFDVVVQNTARDTRTVAFSGKTLGGSQMLIGSKHADTRQVRVPIYAENTETTISIETDSVFPCKFVSAEWEGRYVTKYRR